MPSKRHLQMAAVAAATVILMALLVILSQDPPLNTPTGPSVGIDPATLPTVDRVRSADQLTTDTLGIGSEAVIQRTDPDTGRLIQEFIFRRITPGETGIFNITQPEARIHIETNQIVRLKSDTGRFIMPADMPQSGEFNDNVTITVYQSPPGTTPDLSNDSPHIILQLHLDRAEFDATLGEVRSQSPVLVNAVRPRGNIDFQGTGLVLQFNQIDQRIEYLEVRRGHSLTYTPHPTTSEGQPADTITNVNANAQSTEAPPGTSPDNPQNESPDESNSRPPTFYTLTFEDNILIKRGDRSATGSQLTAIFSLDRTTDPTDPTSPTDPTDPTTRVTPTDPTTATSSDATLSTSTSEPHPESTEAITAAADSAEQSTEDTTLINPLAQDPDLPLEMTWTGRMVMEPLSQPPAQLTDQNDLLIALTGIPVHLALGPEDSLDAASITYQNATATATAIGSPVSPLQINSPKLGEVRGQTLTMNLDGDTIRLDGPGTIRANDPPAEQPDTQTAAAENTNTPPSTNEQPQEPEQATASALPAGMRIRWSQAVELIFGKLGVRGGAVRSASFLGDARVTDPRFEMNANLIRAAFASEDAEGNPLPKPQLEGLDAEGDVDISTEDGSMNAQLLVVYTDKDEEGRLAPSRMIATGDVRLIDPNQRLEAQELDIELEPATPETGHGTTESTQSSRQAPNDAPAEIAPPEQPKTARLESAFGANVKRLAARGNVRLGLADGTDIYANQLNADAQTKSARLIGEPVRIVRKQADTENTENATPISTSELEVLNLDITDNGRLVASQGPGLFRFTEADKLITPDPDPAAPSNTPATQPYTKPGKNTAVTWHQRLNYNDKTQVLNVTGSVAAGVEDDPQSLNELRANQLALELIDPERLKAEAEQQANQHDSSAAPVPQLATLSTGSSLGNLGGKRQLQRLTAAGDVVVLGTQWTDASRTTLETRLQIKGQRLTYRELDQLVRIEGPGDLLVEDRRTKPAENTPPNAPPTTPAPTNNTLLGSRISGRGVTFFTWEQLLQLSGSANTLAMRGNVQMTHVTDDDTTIDLWAQNLEATLEPVGDIAPMQLTETGSLSIKTIDATGSVQITDRTKTITADSLHYDGSTQTVTLSARTGNWVEVIDPRSPTPLRGAVISWNLANDRIIIERAGF